LKLKPFSPNSFQINSKTHRKTGLKTKYLYNDYDIFKTFGFPDGEALVPPRKLWRGAPSLVYAGPQQNIYMVIFFNIHGRRIQR